MENELIEEDEFDVLDDPDAEVLDNLSDSAPPPDSDSDEGENLDSDEHPPEFVPERNDAHIFFTGHADAVYACTLSCDGTIAASGSKDDKAHLWDVSEAKVLFTCEGHKDSVTHVGFNHDDSILATIDMGGTVQTWDTKEYKLLWSTTDVGDITWMNWHRSTNVLIVGTDDGMIWMWMIPHGHTKQMPSIGQATTCGCFMPDGKHVLAGYSDGSLRIWDLKAVEAVLAVSNQHEDSVVCVDPSKNGLLIASGASDGVCLSLTSNGSVASKITGFKDAVECVTFSPNDQLLAVGALDGSIVIWDVNAALERHRIGLSEDTTAGITKIIWLDDFRFLASSLDGVVRLYDARSGDIVRDWHGHSNQILDLAVAKDRTVFITASEDETCGVFTDLSSNENGKS